MTLLNNIISSSIEENKINKRLADYSLKSNINKKEPLPKKTKVKSNAPSLLKKIVSSNLNENLINKRLEEMAYSAIRGQRQEAKNYQPEGVQMLGQMNREKPLTAITKEMIKDYQEEQAKPFMVDGEPRQFFPATYKPQFEDLEIIEDDLNMYNENLKYLRDELKPKIADELSVIDNQIKKAHDDLKVLKEKTDKSPMGFYQLLPYYNKQDEIKRLQKAFKEKEAEFKKVNYNIEQSIKKINELKKLDANELKKYETSIIQHNINRLDIKQQPYESDYDYYQRLKEVEATKYDPLLYKQYAINKNVKELKEKFGELFNDLSFIERVVKKIPDEYKFIINKNFDTIKTKFLNEYGYNPNISETMASDNLKILANELLNTSASKLKALFKRKTQREIYSDTIPLYRDRIDREERQAEENRAATNIQRIVRGNQSRLDTVLMRNQNRIRALNARREEEERQAQQENEASTNIQRVLRGHRGRQRTQQIREREAREIQEAEQIAQQMRERAFQARREQNRIAARERQQERMNELVNARIQEDAAIKIEKAILDKVKRNRAIKALDIERKNRNLEGIEIQPSNQAQNIPTFIGSETIKPKPRRGRPPKKTIESGVKTRRKREQESKFLYERTMAKERAQQLQELLNKPGMKRLHDISKQLEEGAKRAKKKEGEGLKKPRRRKAKISEEDKNKNRLRLVVAQIHAGNTNPRLITEVNELYKMLYNIDNAYMHIIQK